MKSASTEQKMKSLQALNEFIGLYKFNKLNNKNCNNITAKYGVSRALLHDAIKAGLFIKDEFNNIVPQHYVFDFSHYGILSKSRALHFKKYAQAKKEKQGVTTLFNSAELTEDICVAFLKNTGKYKIMIVKQEYIEI